MTVFDDIVSAPASHPGVMLALPQADQGQKLRMRPWLEQQLDGEKYHGLRWLDKKEKKFKVPWIHASSQHFNHTVHSAVFKAWAVHTGRFDPDSAEVSFEKQSLWKTWKANFRCALNSLPDVIEVRGESSKAKGEGAYKVYRMTDRKPKRRKSRGHQTRTHASPVDHKPGRVTKKRAAPTKPRRHHRGKQLAALVRKTFEEAPPFGNTEHATSEKLPTDHAFYTKSQADSGPADSLLNCPPRAPEVPQGPPGQFTDTFRPVNAPYVKMESSSDDGSDSDNNSVSDSSDNAPTDEEVVEDVLGLEETHSNRGNSPVRDADETVLPTTLAPLTQAPSHCWASNVAFPNTNWPHPDLQNTFGSTTASCSSSSVNIFTSPAVVVQPSRSVDPLPGADSLLTALDMDESTMKEILNILHKAKTTALGQTAYSTTLTTTARPSQQQSVNFGGADAAQGTVASTTVGLVPTSTLTSIPVPRQDYLHTSGLSNGQDFTGFPPTTSAHAQPPSLLHSLVQGGPTNIITTTTVSG